MKQIRYFVTVVEERNITRAAARLGIQQPPLSAQMKNFEQRVGARLLTRVPGGVEPTPAGLALYEECRRILDSFNTAIENAQRIDRGEAGRLVLGVTQSTISHPLVKQIITKFVRKRPDVELAIVTHGSAELRTAVAENQVDIAFARPSPGAERNVREENLISEPMVVAAPAGLPLPETGRTPGLNLEELAQHRLILFRDSTDPRLYNDILQAFGKRHVQLEQVQQVPTANIALDLVSAGLGVTIVPKSLSEKVLPDVQVIALKGNQILRSNICLTTRRVESSKIVQDLRRITLRQLNNSPSSAHYTE